MIYSVGTVFMNMLELVTNCMTGNRICKMIFSTQVKYQEMFEILKLKRLPLIYRSYFYRILFESYYSTNRVSFKKVLTLIHKVLVDELEVLNLYSEHHQKLNRRFPNLRNFSLGLKKQIAKKQVQSEDFDYDVAEMYEEGEEKEDIEQSVDLSEKSVNGEEDEEDDGPDDAPDALSKSKDFEVFNQDRGTLETIWFDKKEIRIFLAARLKNNRIDGFIPFVADLVAFLLFNVKKQNKLLERSKNIINDFFDKLQQFTAYFSNFEKYFEKEIFSHSELLLMVSIENLYKVREEAKCLVENEDKTRSMVRNIGQSSDYSMIGMNRYFGFGRRRQTPSKGLNLIDEAEELNNDGDTVMHEEEEFELEKKAEELIKLIKHSLISLKMTFSEALKDLFEDNLLDLEQKLVKLIEGLITKAKLVKYNFFITIESGSRISMDSGDIERVIRFFFYKLKNTNDMELGSLAEELQVELNEVETIALIMNLNKVLYKTETADKANLNFNQLVRVESFTEIELTGYFEAIEAFQLNHSRELENFLSNQSFHSMFLNLTEFNLLEIQRSQLGSNNYVRMLDDFLFGYDLALFKQFFRRKTIEKCLSNHTSRFFYIHSLRISIGDHLMGTRRGPQVKGDFLSELNLNQKLLNDKYVGYFCLKVLISKKSEGEIIMSECLEILYLMLVYGNKEVQADLYRVIINNYGDFNLVEFFERHLKFYSKKIKEKLLSIEINYKNQVNNNKERVVKKRFLNIDRYRLVVNILRFLQVLNENCFTQFQDLFREQKFYNQNTNNNLIQKIIDIVISLGEHVSIFDNSTVHAGTESEETSQEETTDGRTLSNFEHKDGMVYSQKAKRKRKIYQSQGFEKMVTAKRDDLAKQQKREKKSRIFELDFTESAKLKSMIHFALFYLNDSMMGPNKKNQEIILSNPGLLDFSLWIIRQMNFPQLEAGLTNLHEFYFNVYDYMLFSDAVQLLLYSTDVFNKSDRYKEIFDQQNIELVKTKMREIYDKIISLNKQQLYSNSFCPELENDFSINQSDFEDVNLSTKSSLLRREIFKNKVNALLFVPQDPRDPLHDERDLEVRKIMSKVIISGHNLFIFFKRSQEFYGIEEKIKEPYFEFFDNFYGYVELKHKDSIEILRYTKPYITYFHYDTEYLKGEFSIEPHNEKINNFIQRVDKEEEKLSNRQTLYRFSRPFYYSTKNKVIVEYLFYFILMLINLLIILNAKHTFDGDLNVTDLDLKRGVRLFQDKLNVSSILLFALGVVNFLLAVMIFIFNFLESIAQTRFYWRQVVDDFSEKKEAIRKKSSKGLLKLYLNLGLFVSGNRFVAIGYWGNFYNFYNIIIMTLSLTSIFVPLFYTFLLLDIIQRSLTLKNIIRSVTNNWQQLILTTIVTLIIMYIYASISFTFFPDQYGHTDDDDFMNYCHTLSQCFFSVLNNGLRAGGGLGEAIGQPTIEDTRYNLRYWVDLTFMIIILIILLNIVFGIIIDTFGDMRNARDEWNNYINNTCILCDLTKAEIDSNGEGYYTHINRSHSIEDYVHFLIYIKNRNLNDCDGIEQTVKIQYENGDYSFLPHQESFYFKKD